MIKRLLRRWLVRRPNTTEQDGTPVDLLDAGDDRERDELARRLRNARARLQLLEWQADVTRGIQHTTIDEDR